MKGECDSLTASHIICNLISKITPITSISVQNHNLLVAILLIHVIPSDARVGSRDTGIPHSNLSMRP